MYFVEWPPQLKLCIRSQQSRRPGRSPWRQLCLCSMPEQLVRLLWHQTMAVASTPPTVPRKIRVFNEFNLQLNKMKCAWKTILSCWANLMLSSSVTCLHIGAFLTAPCGVPCYCSVMGKPWADLSSRCQSSCALEQPLGRTKAVPAVAGWHHWRWSLFTPHKKTQWQSSEWKIFRGYKKVLKSVFFKISFHFKTLLF